MLLFYYLRKDKEEIVIGQKDILLKNYFTPDIFADAINAILYDGKEQLNMCEAFEGLIEEGRKEELKNKYKSWVTLSRNLEKKCMSRAEIDYSLGISELELAEAFRYMDKDK